MAEQPLDGGIANAGRVVRVGPHVLRPSSPHSGSIHAFLRAHDAALGFDPQGLTWDDSLADPAGGTLVCHNDVCPENVVFRDGIAVALLDFANLVWPSRSSHCIDTMASSNASPNPQ